MKKVITIAAVATGLALSAATSQAQLAIGDSDPNGLVISGQTLTLGNFAVANDAALTGTFGGSFTIDTPATSIPGGYYASISGSQSFTISGNGTLTGTVTLVDIYDYTPSGLINNGLAIDITNVKYSGGTDADLEYLATTGSDVLKIASNIGYNATTQQFYTIPAGSSGTTYAGTLESAPVPEVSTVMAGALMLLPLGIGAIRAVRKERSA